MSSFSTRKGPSDLAAFIYFFFVQVHVSHNENKVKFTCILYVLQTGNLQLSARFVGDYKMVKIISYWLVDSVDYYNY